MPQVPYWVSVFSHAKNSTVSCLGSRRRWSLVVCHCRCGLLMYDVRILEDAYIGDDVGKQPAEIKLLRQSTTLLRRSVTAIPPKGRTRRCQSTVGGALLQIDMQSISSAHWRRKTTFTGVAIIFGELDRPLGMNLRGTQFQGWKSPQTPSLFRCNQQTAGTFQWYAGKIMKGITTRSSLRVTLSLSICPQCDTATLRIPHAL